MLTLIVILLVLYAALALLVTAWSMFFQSRLYTEVSEGLPWRGPAAAGAILFPILLWLLAARGSPGTYRPIWEFASRTTGEPYKKLLAPDKVGKLETYAYRPGENAGYFASGNRRLEDTPDFVVVEEDGKQVTFKPDKDEKGNFKVGKSSGLANTTTEELHYRDESGRVMLKGTLGRLTVYKTGAFWWNILLHLLLLAACFLGLWLLCRFQWLHALGQAVVLGALLLLFVIPLCVANVEAAAKP